MGKSKPQLYQNRKFLQIVCVRKDGTLVYIPLPVLGAHVIKRHMDLS